MLSVRILYDSQIFWRQKYGGISRYFAEIAERISRYADSEVTVFAPVHRNAYLRGACAPLVTGYAMDLPAPLFRYRGLLNEGLSWAAFRLRRPDIIHETYYSSRRVAPTSALVVLTVYDMIHELRPGDFRPDDATAAAKRRAVHRADHIICISRSTRDDLLRLCNVNPDKVSVIHLGHSLRTIVPPITDFDSVTHAQCPRRTPYILFVGDRHGYKNFTAFVRAYAHSSMLRGAFQVVAFGGGSFTAVESDQLRALGLREEEVVHEDGNDDALAHLYIHAHLLVYPSLYEGFGIPILEAMAYGCPVVAAHTSSIPEVAGDAAELFDPQTAGTLTEAIMRVAFDAGRRQELRRRGVCQAHLFSWERCARDTHALYQQMLGRK
jgi:glycosyltransferase involved in cell wall biosynthesis